MEAPCCPARATRARKRGVVRSSATRRCLVCAAFDDFADAVTEAEAVRSSGDVDLTCLESPAARVHCPPRDAADRPVRLLAVRLIRSRYFRFGSREAALLGSH